MALTIKNKQQLEKYIENGGDINIQNYLGQTLLHKVIIEDNTELFDLLIEKDVKFLKDITNNTPLHYVKNEETALKLINKGCNFDKTNVYSNVIYKKIISGTHT